MSKNFLIFTICLFSSVSVGITSEIDPKSVLQRRMSTTIVPDLSSIDSSDDSEKNLPINEDSKNAAIILKKLQSMFGSYVDNDNYGGATVVDISYPAVKKYVLKVFSEKAPQLKPIEGQMSEEAIENLSKCETFTNQNIWEIIKFADMFEQEVSTKNINPRHLDCFVNMCFGDNKFFKVSDGSDKLNVKNIFKTMISNYTGFQRVMSIILIKLSDKVNPTISELYKTPIIIALDEVIDDEKTAVYLDNKNTVLLFSKQYKTENEDLITDSLCHELTHAWQYLLDIGGDLWYLNEFVIQSLFSDSKKSYVSTYFPMLQKDVMEKNVNLIASKLPENDILQKYSSETFSKLKGYINDIGFGKLITDELTKENIAKAIYLCATNYYYEYNYGYSEYSKGYHCWRDPLEMLTMFGIIPFRFENQTILIVDRQNENIFAHRSGHDIYNSYYSEVYFDPIREIVLYILDFKNDKEKTEFNNEFSKYIQKNELYNNSAIPFDKDQENPANQKFIPSSIVNNNFLSNVSESITVPDSADVQQIEENTNQGQTKLLLEK